MFLTFLGATKHLYNWLCPLVGWLVGWSVGNAFIKITESRILRYAIAPLASSLFFIQWKQRFSQMDQSEMRMKLCLSFKTRPVFALKKTTTDIDKSLMKKKKSQPITNDEWEFPLSVGQKSLSHLYNRLCQSVGRSGNALNTSNSCIISTEKLSWPSKRSIHQLIHKINHLFNHKWHSFIKKHLVTKNIHS